MRNPSDRFAPDRRGSPARGARTNFASGLGAALLLGFALGPGTISCGAAPLGAATLAAGASGSAARSGGGTAGAAVSNDRGNASVHAPVQPVHIAVENLEGALLISSTLSSDARRDTTGLLVLDTGAGYLALDTPLLQALGLADSGLAGMSFAPRPVKRLRAGGFQQDVVGPVLAIDVEIIRQATDRPVIGLFGQQPLASFAVQIDYRRDSLALFPMRRDGIMATLPRRRMAVDMAASSSATAMATRLSREQLGAALDSNAVSIPFELEGDGKIIVEAQVGTGPAPSDERRLTLILDTGATKTVLFGSALRRLPRDRAWRELHGLSAPTFYGSESTYLARVPGIRLGGKQATLATEVDVAVLDGPLQDALSLAVRRPVDGLLGASFLRRFRVTIDYPHRLLWLEPLDVSRDQREFEYSHVGIQLERRGAAIQVVAVAAGSPADRAGIRPGDELVEVDESSVRDLELGAVSRRLEGPPGSRVGVGLVRDGAKQRYRLERRQLL